MTKLLLTLVTLALLWPAPVRAEKDPDLGMDMVAPPAAASNEAAAAPADDGTATQEGTVPEPLPSSELAEAPAEANAPVPPSGIVARSSFTTSVADREPQDEVAELANDHGRVLFFTELRGLQDQTVIHRWTWKGQVMAEIPFQIGGPRWRVYSVKSLDPAWLGQWTVDVVDGSGHVVGSDSFVYRQSSPGAKVEHGEALADGSQPEWRNNGKLPASVDEAAMDPEPSTEPAEDAAEGAETDTETDTAEEPTADPDPETGDAETDTETTPETPEL